MSIYCLRFLSFESHSLNVILTILNLPEIRKLIFPAHFHIDEHHSIELSSIEKNDFSELSEYCKNDAGWRINLLSNTNIKLSISINDADDNSSSVPNALVLIFRENNFQEGEVDLTIVKSLFATIIPLFMPYSGTLYEENTSLRLTDDGFYKGFCVEVDEHFYSFEAAWVSYCGPEQLKFSGRKRFQNLRNCLETYDLHDGLMIVLQEDPYDDSNFIHRQRLEALIHELNFEELVVK